MTGAPRNRPGGSPPLVLALAIGLGLVLAPAVFGMFTRAPAGGAMLDDFRPFMDEDVLADFRGHLERIDAAHAERAHLVAGTSGDPDVPAAIAAMDERWPAIQDEMSAMLADISANVDNYAAVDALPPFPLFPWFFVLPGLAIAALAATALRASSRGRDPRRLLVALALVGVATASAPLAFQMFTRAPAGAAMIDDLRPLMTVETVQAMQGHFLTIAAFEGELRNEVLAGSEAPTGPEASASAAFVEAWPRISGEMAPMIGAMSDHLDSFAGIDALPPFTLFPWFFVVPGLFVAAAALWALVRARGTAPVRPAPSAGADAPLPAVARSPSSEPSPSPELSPSHEVEP